jgi:hypothetical protein
MGRILAGVIPRLTGEFLPGGGHDAGVGRCRPSCCKTPLGHSTVRDNYPAWHKLACHCHVTPKPEVKADEQTA